MRHLVHPLQREFYARTETLILGTAPERSECVQDWPKELDEAKGERYVRRDYVAVDANDPYSVVGYGSIWLQGDGQFRMDLIVAQEWRCRGVGNTLFQTLQEALRTQKATLVQARAFDYQPQSLAFLMHRGFTETNRVVHQRLTVANAVTDTQTKLTADLHTQGITIVTLDQEQRRSTDWRAKILELLCAAYQVGSDRALLILEDVARIWERSPHLSADAVFLAKRSEEYVGWSFLSRVDTTSRGLVHGDTAVHIDWRRKGIATLLKLHTISYARQNGYEAISTRTANAGMDTLNKRLGFQPERAEVRLVKRIEMSD